MHFNDNKSLNVDKILNNYAEFRKLIAITLDTSVDIINDKWSTNSLFLDPITVMLFSKDLVKDGYYIHGIEVDGVLEDRIFNSQNIPMSIEDVETMISNFRDRNKNFFIGDFTNFKNGSNSLNDFLSGMTSAPPANITKMMGFINRQYNFVTGQMEGSFNMDFNYGIHSYGDNTWSMISKNAGIGHEMLFGWDDAAMFLAGYLGGKALDYAGSKALDYFGKLDYYNTSLVMLPSAKVGQIAADISMDFGQGDKKKDILDHYKRAASGMNIIADLISAKVKILQDKRALLNQSIKGLDDGMKTAKENGDSVEYNRLNKQRTRDIIERDLLNQAIIDAKKKEKAAIDKAREAERENIIAKGLLEGVSVKSCSTEMANPECGSGVGPAGDPMLILQKKAPKALMDLLFKNINQLKVIPQECNPITQVCGISSSLEITPLEMNKIISMAAIDDASCIHDNLEGCSFDISDNSQISGHIPFWYDSLPLVGNGTGM